MRTYRQTDRQTDKHANFLKWEITSCPNYIHCACLAPLSRRRKSGANQYTLRCLCVTFALPSIFLKKLKKNQGGADQAHAAPCATSCVRAPAPAINPHPHSRRRRRHRPRCRQICAGRRTLAPPLICRGGEIFVFLRLLCAIFALSR